MSPEALFVVLKVVDFHHREKQSKSTALARTNRKSKSQFRLLQYKYKKSGGQTVVWWEQRQSRGDPHLQFQQLILKLSSGSYEILARVFKMRTFHCASMTSWVQTEVAERVDFSRNTEKNCNFEESVVLQLFCKMTKTLISSLRLKQRYYKFYCRTPGFQ